MENEMGYIHIENLYKNRAILLFKECYALEKIHGCVKDDTTITTKNGEKIIKELDKGESILTLDCDKNIEEYCEVTNIFIKKRKTDWYEIETEDGNKLIITGNHYVWLPELKCYRKVKDLKEGDFLLKK